MKPVRPRRRRLRLLVLAVSLVLMGTLLGLGAALTCRPSWYDPPSIDYARLREDKRAQLLLENSISAALNEGRPARIEIDDAQVNRWIAARDELWPGKVPSLEPFQRPHVTFLDDDRIRFAALVEWSGVQVVFSATFHVKLQGTAVAVSWDSARAGLMPAPLTLIEEAGHRVIRELRLKSGEDGEGIEFPAEAVWPNGRRRFRITEVSIHGGVARMALEPL